MPKIVFDWLNNQISSLSKMRAELFFLKMFTSPRPLNELRESELWQRILGDTAQSTASRLIGSGMLQEGGVEVTALLESKSKDELQSLAKALGISQSGTKRALAERLFKADSNGMSDLFRENIYFICTPQGRLVIEKFLESEMELRLEAEMASQSALRRGHYEEACKMVADFEASQPFPRGVGIDWTSYDPTHDVEILKEIAAYSPERHRRISEDILVSLRVSAGMMNLWGESNPLKWLTGSEREFAREARMILFAAIGKVRLKEFNKIGIQQVKILGSGRDDACITCKKADGKIYRIHSAPELPHGRCTCEYGCGCMLIAAS